MEPLPKLFTAGAAETLAAELADHYGEDAVAAAADRRDALRELGRAEAARLWSDVVEILSRARGRGRKPEA